MVTENPESERKELNDLNREIMEVQADYEDFFKRATARMNSISLRIFRLKKRIDTLADGEK
jgi:hypothetical protein